MTELKLAEVLLLDSLLILASLSTKLKMCRTLAVMEILLITLQNSIAVKVSNSSHKQLRPAIIEVRQQTLEDDGREIVALLLKGRFSGLGVTQEASGELIKVIWNF